MRPTVSQYAEALEELRTETKPEVLARNLKSWLKRRGEEKKFPLIVKALERRMRADEKKIVVTAVTAHPLEKEAKVVVMKKAEKLFPHQTIELESRVDSSVIGGVKLSTDEQLYDATVSTQLKFLKNSLLKG
jgi:F0F1-type ATP synthase delta subunit